MYHVFPKLHIIITDQPGETPDWLTRMRPRKQQQKQPQLNSRALDTDRPPRPSPLWTGFMRVPGTVQSTGTKIYMYLR